MPSDHTRLLPKAAGDTCSLPTYKKCSHTVRSGSSVQSGPGSVDTSRRRGLGPPFAWRQFSYVPSKANVSDLPSRGEFALLREMRSVEVAEVRWPEASQSWLEAVRGAFREFAPAKLRQEKRWRSEIVEAIEVERRRRAAMKRKRDAW